MNPRKLELLAPAADANTAIQAILHGADAVYIGPPSHGARKAAANSISEIEKVVDFSHKFGAKVYATVNTIVYEDELHEVEKLCKDLYKVGVDALIVQDMGILRMDLPPIALHASTQCDIRTPDKAKFLEEVGFSQLVLARELTLSEIKAITDVVKIPVESFVHGALCVSYSGRCHASFALNGRSANRGECAQICRYPYSLIDKNDNIIAKDKYLLSLKDFNASHNLENLIEAGVSSFKIEGRLKEVGYVKNITSFYNEKINHIIKSRQNELCRTSFGIVTTNFKSDPSKSFNRGFTNYFLDNRKPLKIASLLTPKSQGEIINDPKILNNGDGISFFDSDGTFTGVNVNKIENGRIIPARKINIPKNSTIHRTSDIKWNKILDGDTSKRKIPFDLILTDTEIIAKDIRGVEVKLPFDLKYEVAKKPMDFKSIFEKLGNTIYELRNFESKVDVSRFYRVSEVNTLKRQLIEQLDLENKKYYKFDLRRIENKKAIYPCTILDYKENVSNSLAEKFYRDHGAKEIDKALEVTGEIKKNDILMTTRHCVLRELGLCGNLNKAQSNIKLINPCSNHHSDKIQKSVPLKFPLYLKFDGGKFLLDFDCKNCEMKVLKQ